MPFDERPAAVPAALTDVERALPEPSGIGRGHRRTNDAAPEGSGNDAIRDEVRA